MQKVWLYGPMEVLGDFQDCWEVSFEKLYIFICRRRKRILPLLTSVEASWHNFWSVTFNQVFGSWKKKAKHLQTPFHPQCDISPLGASGVDCSWLYFGGPAVADLLLRSCFWYSGCSAGLSWANSGEAVSSRVWLGEGSWSVFMTPWIYEGSKVTSPGRTGEGLLRHAPSCKCVWTPCWPWVCTEAPLEVWSFSIKITPGCRGPFLFWTFTDVHIAARQCCSALTAGRPQA